MISCDSLPDVYWFYYCYIVFHNRRGDTSPHLLLFYRISWVYRRVSPLLWTIASSCISAWRRGEIKGDSIVSGDWCGEKVKSWKCENVKMWNRGVFVKKRGKRKAKPPMGTASCELGIIHCPLRRCGTTRIQNTKKQLSADRGKAVRWWRKRREQDSNLRTGFAGYTLSRRASSTARAPLLLKNRCKITENIVCRRMLPIIIMKN